MTASTFADRTIGSVSLAHYAGIALADLSGVRLDDTIAGARARAVASSAGRTVAALDLVVARLAAAEAA